MRRTVSDLIQQLQELHLQEEILLLELADARAEESAQKAPVAKAEEPTLTDKLHDKIQGKCPVAIQECKAEEKQDKVDSLESQCATEKTVQQPYLRQISDLETEVKKISTLQEQVDTLQVQMASLEKEPEKSDSLQASATELDELKNLLALAEKANNMYASELKELREQQAMEQEEVNAVQGLDNQAPQLSAEQKEKMMRFGIENKKLKEEMEKAKNSAPAATSAAAGSEDVGTLQAEVARLQAELAKKQAENKKIVSDKDELEAYTKRTLAKFQDEYLVHVKECRAKLKEKQDMIENLKSRSATEKTAQKRYLRQIMDLETEVKKAHNFQAKSQDKYLVALQESKAKLKEKQGMIENLKSRYATEKTAQKRYLRQIMDLETEVKKAHNFQAKSQDKYLVALQETKTKLKEKQDKIEMLESRSAIEDTAHKRQERLLSSTIYEMGLTIMNNRLK